MNNVIILYDQFISHVTIKTILHARFAHFFVPDVLQKEDR